MYLGAQHGDHAVAAPAVRVVDHLKVAGALVDIRVQVTGRQRIQACEGVYDITAGQRDAGQRGADVGQEIGDILFGRTNDVQGAGVGPVGGADQRVTAPRNGEHVPAAAVEQRAGSARGR